MGTFAYTPGIGAILAPGVQTLKVTFTPSDTTDYATATGQVMITVTQPPLNISPASLNFGNVYLGFPAVGTIVISNPGTAAVQITSMKLVLGTADSDDYGALTNCSKTLKAGGACAIAVGFLANDLGVRTASIVITDSASSTPQTIPLTATVIKKGK